MKKPGTRVAGAVGARVVQAHHAAHDHGERERADQVGRQGGERRVQGLHGGQGEKKRFAILRLGKARPVSERTAHRLGAEQARQHRRFDAHEVTAPPAVDADARQHQRRLFHVHRHRLAQPERRGATDLVAAVALRHLGLARLDRLGADLPRQVLGADLFVAVHQHDQRLSALVLHHKSLDDLGLGHAELARRLCRAAVLDVLVDMLGERDAVFSQELSRRRLADVRLLLHGFTAPGRGGSSGSRRSSPATRVTALCPRRRCSRRAARVSSRR